MIEEVRPALVFAAVVGMAVLTSNVHAHSTPRYDRQASAALRVFRVPAFELGWEHLAFSLSPPPPNGRGVMRLEDRLSPNDRIAAHRALTDLKTAAFSGSTFSTFALIVLHSRRLKHKLKRSLSWWNPM